MSIVSDDVLSTAITSDNCHINNHGNDATVVQHNDYLHTLSSNVTNKKSDTTNLQEHTHHQVLDGIVKTDKMQHSEISTEVGVTTTTANGDASTTTNTDQQRQAPMSQQKQHVIHYPAEFMQLGKRKFHNLESSCSAYEQSQTLQNFTLSNENNSNNNNNSTCSTSNVTTSTQISLNSIDNEAGLSLLFAASLLQQQQQQQQHCQPTDNSTAETTSASVTENTALYTEQYHQTYDQPTCQDTSHKCNIRPINEEKKMKVQLIEHEVDGSIIEPKPNDVLCGRGGGINKHYGNIIYRRVVEYNKRVYKQVPKRHRMLVSRSIVQAIINAGGRFLQQQDDKVETSVGEGITAGVDEDAKPMKLCRWTPIPIRRAVQKTSQALRERSCTGNNSNEDDEPESHAVI